MIEIGSVTNGVNTYNAFKFTKQGYTFYFVCDQILTGVRSGLASLRAEMENNYHWISDLGSYIFTKNESDPFNGGFSDEFIDEGN